MLETTEILNRLLTLCNEQKSGTLFLTTADNKACHIIFENGRIEAMAFGSVKGIAVANLLPRLLIERTSFNSTLRMPLSERANIEDQANIFAALGLRRQQIAETEVPDTVTKTPRMYRGHLIVDQNPLEIRPKPVKPAVESSAETAPKKSKSKRIYRGQVIED